MEGVNTNWSQIPLVNEYSTSVLKALAPQRVTNCEAPKIFEGAVDVRPLATPLSADYCAAAVDDPRIAEADEQLQWLWPEQWHQFASLVQAFYPIDRVGQPETVSWGCVCGNRFDMEPMTLYASIWGVGGIMEGWVHELGHLKLHLLGVHLETWDDRFILNTPAELYESPVRKDKLRPMGAVLHGLYSYVHVTEIEFRAAQAGDTDVIPSMLINRNRLIEGMATVETNLQATVAGREFWTGLRAWTEALIDRTSAF